MPEVLITTTGMTREEWLQERRKGIGGSDAAKVLGVSRWGGPLSVYLEKKGLYVPEDPGEPAYWGTVLEDVVAREFEKRSGLKVQRQNKIFTHPDHPWMLANIDRRIVGQNKGLECKTASNFMGDEWKGDELPDSYYIQIQHYMAVMGWESCWVACLIGGQRYVQKEVQRNPELINTIIDKEREFWEEHFLKDVPPPVTPFDNPNSLWPEQTEDDMVQDIDDETITIARSLAGVQTTIKGLENEEERLKGILKAQIGEMAGIQGICSWKQTKSKMVTDWQSVAIELGAESDIISRHTEEKPGSRRFLLDKSIVKGA
ncbi:MAG: YqaJ viral recombinase family protein [Candidatus Methanomethylophilaceae archaeon]